jgi:hypothetical protein
MVNLVLYLETIWTVSRWQINLHTLNANMSAELYSHNIVTHKTIARQQFSKHISKVTFSTVEGHPLLGSKSLGTFPWQWIGTQW